MIKITVDKIASATKNVPLRREIRISPEITAQEGYIVCGRIHGEKSSYNTLENCDGRMVSVHDGDIVVGVLGHRNALHGYSGVVPEKVSVGDRLHILNLGGVVGRCTSVNPQVGSPFEFEVLGSVLVFPEFGSRVGIAAHVKMNALTEAVAFNDTKKTPIIFLAGTCMNAGKTLAACQVIRHLSAEGVKIAACKVTGVSLLRDVLNMQDYGATYASSFVDAGIVTTSAETARDSARTVIGHLSQTDADVIVAELGDGILGLYGVGKILEDKEIMERCKAFVLCANDPVGAWGSVELLKQRYGITIDVITGPATDNDVGTKFIKETLGIDSCNARIKGKEFSELVYRSVSSSLA